MALLHACSDPIVTIKQIYCETVKKIEHRSQMHPMRLRIRLQYHALCIGNDVILQDKSGTECHCTSACACKRLQDSDGLLTALVLPGLVLTVEIVKFSSDSSSYVVQWYRLIGASLHRRWRAASQADHSNGSARDRSEGERRRSQVRGKRSETGKRSTRRSKFVA